MNDILGTKIERRGGKLLSSNLVTLTIADAGTIGLGTGANGTYGRAITPTEVFGSTVVYYTQGPSQGRIDVSTVVGENGFFANLGANSICELSSLDVTGTNECGSGSDSFSIGDALLESLGFGWQAGATPVQNSMAFMFGTMSR